MNIIEHVGALIFGSDLTVDRFSAPRPGEGAKRAKARIEAKRAHNLERLGPPITVSNTRHQRRERLRWEADRAADLAARAKARAATSIPA